jgi:hypothetical protein
MRDLCNNCKGAPKDADVRELDRAHPKRNRLDFVRDTTREILR